MANQPVVKEKVALMLEERTEMMLAYQRNIDKFKMLIDKDPKIVAEVIRAWVKKDGKGNY